MMLNRLMAQPHQGPIRRRIKRRNLATRMSEPSFSRPVAISSLAVRLHSFVAGVKTPPGWRVVAFDVAVLPRDGRDRGNGHLDG